MNKKDFNQMPKLAINFLLKENKAQNRHGWVDCLSYFSFAYFQPTLHPPAIIKMRDKVLMGRRRAPSYCLCSSMYVKKNVSDFFLLFFSWISLLMENLWQRDDIENQIEKKVIKKRKKKKSSSHIDVAFIYVCFRKFNFFPINFFFVLTRSTNAAASCRFHLQYFYLLAQFFGDIFWIIYEVLSIRLGLCKLLGNEFMSSSPKFFFGNVFFIDFGLEFFQRTSLKKCVPSITKRTFYHHWKKNSQTPHTTFHTCQKYPLQYA